MGKLSGPPEDILSLFKNASQQFRGTQPAQTLARAPLVAAKPAHLASPSSLQHMFLHNGFKTHTGNAKVPIVNVEAGQEESPGPP